MIIRINEWYGAWQIMEDGVFTSSQKVMCRCMCSAERAIRAGALISGRSLSCGCAAPAIKKFKRVMRYGVPDSLPGHGPFASDFIEIRALYGAIASCNSLKGHKDYGKRGIRVCDEWTNDPWSFIRYMGLRPTSAHSIDRKT